MNTEKRKIIDGIRNGSISLTDIDKELFRRLLYYLDSSLKEDDKFKKEIEKYYPNFFIENCNRINL